MNQQTAAAVAFRDFVEVYDVVLPLTGMNRSWAEKIAENAISGESFVGSPTTDNALVNSGRR